MPPCLARFSKVWVKFGDGKHRFLQEDMCGKVCDAGMQRCPDCSKAKQTKTQDVRTFDHGLINGDFTKESHMFDSPWFHTALEKYGAPKPEDLQLAMEIQRKARAATGVAATVVVEVAAPVPVAAPIAAPVELPPVKLKKTRAKKEPTEKKPPVEKKPRAKKVTKKEDIIVPPENPVKAVEVIPPTAAFVETTDDPIQVSDVIRVVLRPFTYNSVRYWRDSERDKVYKRTPEGKRGAYIGRWDSDAQEINKDSPDSDEE